MLVVCHPFSICFRSFSSYILSRRTMRRFSFRLTVLVSVQSPIRDTMRIQPHRFIVLLPSESQIVERKKRKDTERKAREILEDQARGMLSTAGVARRVEKDRRKFGNKTLYRRLTAEFRSLTSGTSKRKISFIFFLSPLCL